MAKLFILFLLLLAATGTVAGQPLGDESATAASTASPGTVRSLLGTIESIDINAMAITIDGGNYRLNESTTVTVRGDIRSVAALSPGDFVTGIVQDGLVKELSIVTGTTQ